MARTLPLNASDVTMLSSGVTTGVTSEGGGLLLTEGGGALLTEAPATVQAGAAGGATLSVGPTAQGEIWQAGFTVAVHCSTNVNEATCRIYCGGGVSPAYFIGGTTWGSTGDSSTNTPQMQVGQRVWAVWTGGDPGAEAYLSITGMRTV
jgi:hypothetical protein